MISNLRINDYIKHMENLRRVNIGAGNESRTRDLNLGKVALYQLSYSRIINAKSFAFRSSL